MKFTLFTISNEQIKEQLSKLQTKVDSLETVKEVQDKIISAKDSQISFLNDQIANIWTPITIVAGIIALVVSYVAWVNKKAEKKVKQGEEQLDLAQEKIEQAKSLIKKSQSTATLAQEKLTQLEEKQEDLNNLATTLISNQKIDMSIRKIGTDLELCRSITDTINKDANEYLLNLTEEQIYELSEIEREYLMILESYHIISINFNTNVQRGQEFNPQDILDGTNRLLLRSMELYAKCIKIKNDLYQ
ncbi:TPA: hypothetical protein QCP98_005403 [Bacillus cereus]|nr:hypothetical protein [Bacillus cereus]HDR4464513.1 hypothetical protein [Bacillus cereus]